MEITLRDLVAIAVIHSIISNPSTNGTVNVGELVISAFFVADEFMKQREIKKEVAA